MSSGSPKSMTKYFGLDSSSEGSDPNIFSVIALLVISIALILLAWNLREDEIQSAILFIASGAVISRTIRDLASFFSKRS
ncbi:hypothetical protein [Dermatophilus congolensis]|uniref:hypothetical protein n=1 Tax=Dermatophilus congolensis TaxID=1863 RepID=UPI001AAFB57A|nr:hypothetical protein [Dermatophilus congolensis]MBO3142997.1 hypothetical protein [Dermatophilus congolensis]MBO3161006.1 hypothetical protein [Dermatophilus congolensis]MBO3163270.1 hypothetical protein [Dermatophilus congolensis]MBO3176827.1 hypothetical protein [Dermatophilus congolensis]MBO3217404.1 hypothetical protein [Dermatophilus congolensis]